MPRLFLQQGRVVMSMQMTHVQSSNIYTPWPYTCTLHFSSSALFTPYPNNIIYPHLTPLQAITTRAQEGGSKELRAQSKNGH